MSDFTNAVRNHGFNVPESLPPPRVMLHFGQAIGDNLLCSTVLRELRRRGQQDIWMMTPFAELFVGSPDVDTIMPMSEPLVKIAQQFGAQFIVPAYTRHDWAHDGGDPIPQAHILAVMCHLAGITGQVSLRPYLILRPEEVEFGRFAPRQIAIQSSGLNATMPMQNKEWIPQRFAAVVDTLKGEFTFVQLGSESDPLLPDVVDLRGKTTARQAAAVLSHCVVFVGLVGFLMHLARSVSCRSVIVYGGRELPRQSGYSCNENISNVLPCSPCWRWNNCGYQHACMMQIQSETVIEAVRRQVGRAGLGLLDDTCDIS